MEDATNQLFIAYLEGNMPAAERKTFEQRLGADDAFKKEFEEFEEIYLVLQNNSSAQRAAVAQTIQNADSKFQYSHPSKAEKGKVISFKPWQYGVAATILLAIGLFIFNPFGKPSYSDYVSQQTISLTQRNEANATLKAAEQAYNSENYEEALILFNTLLAAEPNDVQIQYYKGRALVETNNFGEADTLLLHLANGQSAYAYKARWMAALSKLKQEDYEATKAILKTIPPTAPEYQKAQKLLKKL